jgi:hypothetical protein
MLATAPVLKCIVPTSFRFIGFNKAPNSDNPRPKATGCTSSQAELHETLREPRSAVRQEILARLLLQPIDFIRQVALKDSRVEPRILDSRAWAEDSGAIGVLRPGVFQCGGGCRFGAGTNQGGVPSILLCWMSLMVM